MPLVHFTERNVIKHLATRSRRTDLTPFELSRTHVDLGRFLAGELLELLPMESCSIQHPQGTRAGWQVAREEELLLLSFMRAGLYVTEGVRELLPRAPVLHVTPERGLGLTERDLQQVAPVAGRSAVLIDSVVNTGASLTPVLQQLRERGAGRLYVLAMVTPVPTAQRLAESFPDVHFLMARISENQYVGKGTTDTGNRLFGTLNRDH